VIERDRELVVGELHAVMADGGKRSDRRHIRFLGLRFDLGSSRATDHDRLRTRGERERYE